mgnify:FL=1
MTRTRRMRTVFAALVVCLALGTALLTPATAVGDNSTSTPRPSTSQSSTAPPSDASPAPGAPPSDASPEGPLVVVFDVSGSMNEQDSSGRNKLEAAKTTMTAMLRAYADSGTDMGIWTYPGGTSSQGCAAGDWIPGVQPGVTRDPMTLDSRIRNLTADGDTPTGPALRAVVDRLKQEGYSSATLLLVSDGESNCGPPPCDVAREVLSEGFSLQVPSIGFTISEEGRQELECISQATSSTYHDADSADQLIDELSKYERQDIELSVSAPTRIRAGGNAELTATITNPSNDTATGLTAVVAMREGDSREIFPTILAPQRRLPNLAPGESVSVTWVATARTDRTGNADWRILVGSQGQGSVLESGTIEVSDQDLTVDDAGELLRDISGPVAVLGDSYSAGEGAGDYLSTGNPACHRSTSTYGALLGGQSTVLISCSGAVTADVRWRYQHPEDKPQVEALGDLSDAPGLVYMTIGGNDIGFEDIVKSCLFADCAANSAWMRTKLASIQNFQHDLEETYRAVLETANSDSFVRERDGAVAPLVISPYPDLLWGTQQGQCDALLSPTEIAFGRAVIQTLNRTVRQAVESLSAQGYPIYYASDVVDFAQPNHTICHDDSYFVRLTPGDLTGHALSGSTQELAHPNALGYRAWAESLIAWSQTEQARVVNTTMPTSRSQRFETIGAFLAGVDDSLTISAEHEVQGTLEVPDEDGRAPSSSTGQVTAVRTGDTLNISVSGVQPGASVTVTVHSAAQSLGTLVADENGTATGAVTVPTNLASGRHTVVVEGLDSEMSYASFETPVEVRGAVSWTFWCLCALTAALIIGGGWALYSVARSRPHSRQASSEDTRIARAPAS